jgi:hypothetical protein
MHHTIEFRVDFTTGLEIGSRDHLERVRIRTGMRVQAQVRPYVVETGCGPIEAADLHFEDGIVARGVRFGQFRFVDSEPESESEGRRGG